MEPNLSDDDLPHLECIDSWIKFLTSTFQVHRLPDVNLVSRVRSNPEVDRRALIPAECTIDGDFILVDVNNEVIAARMEDGANERYRGVDEHVPLRACNIRANADLEKVWPAEVPRSTESRDAKDTYAKDVGTYHKEGGLPYGVHHFGIWGTRGHERGMAFCD